MKNSILLLFLFLFSQNVLAQNGREHLALNVLQYLHHMENSPENNRNVAMYKNNGEDYISAFIRVSDHIKEEALSQLGVIVGTKAGNIWTVRIPVNQMISFTQISGIEYMELDRTVRLQMDSARYYANVDSAMLGIGLPLPLTGKDVVVGISDNGFDFTHPTWYDNSYAYSRVKRVWIQSINGTPPEGYSYGAEFKDSLEIFNQKNDGSLMGSHGIMVGSLAAGSGLGTSDSILFRGIAYKSDLVLVSCPTTYLDWRAMNMTTLVDGFDYVFKYAESVGKPSLLNASLGTVIGPQDGTSLFSQACDNLVGPGKILVFSAGNSGGKKVHVTKSLTPTDTVLNTLVPNLRVDNGLNKNYIDIWGDSLRTFCLRFSMYKNGSIVNTSATYCLDNSVKDFFLIGSDNDTCFITLATKEQENNKRPHASFELYSKTNDTLLISAISSDGNIHMWQEYFDTSWNTYYGSFLGNGTWITEGDDNYTVGEMGCTQSAITVGATVSKKYWLNWNNFQLNNPTYGASGTLAPYSSRGPDINGKMKPNICAPGGMIVSATSSFDRNYLPLGSLFNTSVVSRYTSPINGGNYYYAVAQGTSFASPMVSGIVALMLQVNPNLSPDKIKEILYQTAIKDSFTTPNPNPALWGAGKINAYAAVKAALQSVEVPLDKIEYNLYPNPTTADFTLEFESASNGKLIVEILDNTGRLVQTKFFEITKGKNKIDYDLDIHTKGIYYVKIIGNGVVVTKKLLLL